MKKWVIIAALLLAVGCKPDPMRGIVAKKNHRGPWTQFLPILAGKTVIVVPVRHPEQWDIVVQSDGTTDEEGQFLVVVSRDSWDKLQVGGIWERSDTVHENK